MSLCSFGPRKVVSESLMPLNCRSDLHSRNISHIKTTHWGNSVKLFVLHFRVSVSHNLSVPESQCLISSESQWPRVIEFWTKSWIMSQCGPYLFYCLWVISSKYQGKIPRYPKFLAWRTVCARTALSGQFSSFWEWKWSFANNEFLKFLFATIIGPLFEPWQWRKVMNRED